ncbi:hypothetical protein JTE90_027768 [Oedothorax gibbosus]|uniref:Guanylate cyclase n=1 Tax=Oedothorax gibbosus TaxID=931172 RepID=A0AAV6V927_9ARAC|nr:hypothetical protein JTE90_027768 [Oedothorax gibbosus]
MSLKNILAILFTTLISLTSGDPSTSFTMGYLTGSKRRPGDANYHRPGLTVSGAISMATDEINRLRPIVFGHLLNFSVAETFGEEDESVLQVARLWTEKVAAYIGPQETCVHEAKMAASFNLPMISYFCAHREVSDKTKYPTFARTRPSSDQISRSVSSLLQTFGWTQISFLYSTDPEGNFKEICKAIAGALNDAGILVKFTGTWAHTYHHGYGENPFEGLVDQSYQDTRIYVVLGYYYEYLGLMLSLQKRGLLRSGEYFVVGVDIEQYELQKPKKYLRGLLRDEIEDDAKKAFQSYIGVVASPPTGFEHFTAKVNAYMQLPPFNFPNPVSSFGGMKKVPAEGAYLYDAVNVYAKALNECLLHNEDPFDGQNLMKYIVGRTYFSAMGYMVYMDENGDAEGNYTLIARKKIPDSNGEYGLYPVGIFQLPENRTSLPILNIFSDIEWVGNGPPLSEPICGFHGKKCVLWKIAIVVAGAIAAVVLLILLVSYKNWAYEQELDSLLWKIDYKDIQINEWSPTANASLVTKNVNPLIRTSQVSLSSNVDGDFRYAGIFTTVGMYKGRMFAVKRMKKKNVDITRKMKKELKLMRDLRHDNLNPFIGACVDPPSISIINEYCSRGSLKDILENEDVKLDNMFNASLIGDIVRGMTYLHESPLKSHGNLTSSKCLVDSRWVVKISDYGLHELKHGADTGDEDMDFEKQCERLLWRAPELIRDPNFPPKGTQKGDIYSFGIILFEIVGRKGPYGVINMSPSEIIKRVLQRNYMPPFRPNTSKLEGAFDCIIHTMHECWLEEPDKRPDFKIIRAKLRPMRRGMKPNIFDNMLAMMEKYANNLEALVDERTDQLNEEKKKTDALLYEMLPKYVADHLKKGHKVEAESFDCVTIYFSDIVGFTSMSAQCSPLEVVEFLNDLYTCFDSIIEHYDVYKVETIGDAYMVVSGLPIQNADNHASEIASMALHLLESIKVFPVKYKPEETLLLRIGMHSGAVCAGVVGRKMPRYCLFGDTVNTASRMESTGLPLRVHCSETCAKLLDKVRGYKLEERGIVNIKGKGEMKTFWLTGQEEWRKKKPKLSETMPTSKVVQPTRRSSMKQPNISSYTGSIKSRRLSLESPKKLRFAPSTSKPSSPKLLSSWNLFLTDKVQLCDRIRQSSPCNEHDRKLNSSWYHHIGQRNSYPHLDIKRCACQEMACPYVNVLSAADYQKGDQILKYNHKEMPKLTSSFVSCFGKKKSFVVHERFQEGNSVLCHSQSEPFLLKTVY